jgi:hypothetical protein
MKVSDEVVYSILYRYYSANGIFVDTVLRLELSDEQVTEIKNQFKNVKESLVSDFSSENNGMSYITLENRLTYGLDVGIVEFHSDQKLLYVIPLKHRYFSYNSKYIFV